jgi:hypothetical protein
MEEGSYLAMSRVPVRVPGSPELLDSEYRVDSRLRLRRRRPLLSSSKQRHLQPSPNGQRYDFSRDVGSFASDRA